MLLQLASATSASISLKASPILPTVHTPIVEIENGEAAPAHNLLIVENNAVIQPSMEAVTEFMIGDTAYDDLGGHPGIRY
ncbi:hypothetical protein [Hymenobacter sp.]|jgi:hypothetical protein|uniref:hypothetical protein n=1 Tax=Hymenobacter sp. TaxID=1898978 RepID=UPI002EDA046C